MRRKERPWRRLEHQERSGGGGGRKAPDSEGTEVEGE
jgi:hypothetical protein